MTNMQYLILVASAVQVAIWEGEAIFDCYDIRRLDDYGNLELEWGSALF